MSDTITGYQQGAADRAAGRPMAVPAGASPEYADAYRRGWERTDSHTSQDNHKSLTRENHTSHESHTGQGVSDEDQQRAEDEALLAGVRNGTWLTVQQFPPLRYAVPGLIPEGLTMLVGPPKAGKSWLVANLLLSIASGGYAVGAIKIPQPRRVFYLALEDGDRRMQSRCRIILGPDAEIPPLYHYVTTVPPGQVVRVMEAWLRRHPDTAMIVLDTLGKVLPPAAHGETSYSRDYRVGDSLRRITSAHPGLSLVVVHHERKATSEDFIDSVSGTHGLAGSMDTVMVLARKRKARDALLMVTGREVPEEEYALLLEDGVHWRLDGANLLEAADRAQSRRESEGISDKSAEIIDYIRSQPDRQATAKELAAEFGRDVYEYLRRHTEAGRIHKVKRGVYSVPS